jgi:hypothetical protein
LGQDAVEVAPSLQHPSAHGMCIIPLPRERDQVVMELIFGKNLDKNTMRSLSRCQGALEITFL